MAKQRIGYIGVGLMGHGAAKNILLKGYPLTIMGHRHRGPVDDLIRQGAKEAKTPAEIAKASDIVFLCLPSTIEVETTVYGADGLLSGAAKGTIIVDSTTADPRSTQRIGADLAKQGIRMADAPVGRTPREAEQGKLSTFIGGDPETVRAVRPIIECYADTIIEAGTGIASCQCFPAFSPSSTVAPSAISMPVRPPAPTEPNVVDRVTPSHPPVGKIVNHLSRYA